MNVLAYIHMRNIHRSTGAGRVARELIENVARREGVNMHILADRSDHEKVAHKVGGAWNTFPYHLFSSATSLQQARWIMCDGPSAESYWPHAEIVHCTMESYVPTEGSRLVVTVHDAAYFDRAHPRTFSAGKQQLKWRILYGTLARSADVFHTVSQFSADRLAHAFPAIRSRLRVICNAVSSIFFAPFDFSAEPPDSVAARLRGRRFILVPGGLHRRKNADMILRAWPILQSRIPDLTLVIAGHNDPGYVPAARSLGRSVKLTGYVEDDLLRALYHGAQAVWFPTHYEGFGIPVLEAMACGTPVIASNTTAIPEVSGDAAILIRPDSVDQNVQAIEAVVNDARLRAEMRERGRRRAAPFTWAASAAQLHAVYSGLV
jgi:glycosyltransferase involved in cell wall biosynthesis